MISSPDSDNTQQGFFSHQGVEPGNSVLCSCSSQTVLHWVAGQGAHLFGQVVCYIIKFLSCGFPDWFCPMLAALFPLEKRFSLNPFSSSCKYLQSIGIPEISIMKKSAVRDGWSRLDKPGLNVIIHQNSDCRKSLLIFLVKIGWIF